MQKKSTRPLGSMRTHLAPPTTNGYVNRRSSSGGDILNREFKYKEPEGEKRRQSFNPEILADRDAPARNNSAASFDRTAKDAETELREKREYDLKERKLKAQMERLENEIVMLKATVIGKEDEVIKLETQIKTIILQTDKYKELYEDEVKFHKETKMTVEKLQEKLSKREEEIKHLKEDHERSMTAIVTKYEADIASMRAAKDKIIAERDDKIGKMKKQMAEAFDGKAWERQHQIEDLTKELKKAHEDMDMLQAKLRQFKRKTSTSCSECAYNKKELERADAKVQEAKEVIDTLHERCTDFEEQLKQQNKFLNEVSRRQKGKA